MATGAVLDEGVIFDGMSQPRRPLLYVHNGPTTFVRKDQRLLSLNYDVITMAVVPRRKWHLPFLLIRQLVQCLVLMGRVDIVVCQFAGYHSLIPVIVARIFGRPTMILANGSDCVGFPSLDYGHFRKRWLGATTRATFRACDLIVPLHGSLVYCEPTYHDIDLPAQGIRYFCHGRHAPTEPLGYGFDGTFWVPKGIRSPMRSITVASNAHTPYVQILKGLDMVLRLAERFPQYEFLIVGADKATFADKPSNLIEIPYVPNEQLPALYGTASFYLQFSVSEGFGNALCEAMLCGCIPIVSDVGAMPEIIGDTGFIASRRDIEVIDRVFQRALRCDRHWHTAGARQRILTHYPEAVRQDGLLVKLNKLLARG